MSKKATLVSEQIRQAIDESGMSRYEICKLAGISQPQLSKFYLGQRGLSTKVLDKLGAVLDLRVSLGPNQKRKG